jgi:hypothetical protein
MIQKAAVTSGTLLSMVRTGAMGIELFTGSPESRGEDRPPTAL